MISVVLMAALATAPEANANVFKRHTRHSAPACCGAPAPCNDCAAPAPCDGCGTPAPAPCDGCGAPAPCDGCGAPAVTPAPAGKDGGQSTPPAVMPKGDKDKVETKKVEEKKTEEKKVEEKKVETKKVEEKKAAEAPIEIPAALKAAIDKSDQKAAIMEYLNNPAVSREQRLQYLETVRQTLLPDEKKKS